MASWFYLFMFGAAALGMWISTQQLALGIMVLDFGIITFWGLIPAIAYPVIAILNVVMLANVWLYKPFTPSYAGG